MKFIECATLTRLNVLLDNIDLGDRVVNAHLELFDTTIQQEPERRLSEQLEEELISQSPVWLTSSPLGPLSRQDVKELLVNLISSMNHCFPDYDFSTLSPAKFQHNEDLTEVCNTIQNKFFPPVERHMPGILQEIWTAVRECLSLPDVEVYSYIADAATDADPFSENDCISSFDYFFVDKKHKRIMSFSCMTKGKFSSVTESDREEREEDLSEEFYGMSIDGDLFMGRPGLDHFVLDGGSMEFDSEVETDGDEHYLRANTPAA